MSNPILEKGIWNKRYIQEQNSTHVQRIAPVTGLETVRGRNQGHLAPKS